MGILDSPPRRLLPMIERVRDKSRENGPEASSHSKITTERVEAANEDGSYQVNGQRLTTVGTAKLLPGEMVFVGWRDGRMQAILAHSAQRAQFHPIAAPGVPGVIEELFLATDPATGKPDVWYRSFEQIRPLGIGPTLAGEPHPLTLSTNLFWSPVGDRFMVSTAGYYDTVPPTGHPTLQGKMYVYKFDRRPQTNFASGQSAARAVTLERTITATDVAFVVEVLTATGGSFSPSTATLRADGTSTASWAGCVVFPQALDDRGHPILVCSVSAGGHGGPAGNATSITSLPVQMGPATFETQAGLDTAGRIVVGITRVTITTSEIGSTSMAGVVTAYSGTSMTINVDTVQGAGTHGSWTLNVPLGWDAAFGWDVIVDAVTGDVLLDTIGGSGGGFATTASFNDVDFDGSTAPAMTYANHKVAVPLVLGGVLKAYAFGTERDPIHNNEGFGSTLQGSSVKPPKTAVQVLRALEHHDSFKGVGSRMTLDHLLWYKSSAQSVEPGTWGDSPQDNMFVRDFASGLDTNVGPAQPYLDQDLTALFTDFLYRPDDQSVALPSGAKPNLFIRAWPFGRGAATLNSSKGFGEDGTLHDQAVLAKLPAGVTLPPLGLLIRCINDPSILPRFEAYPTP